MRKVWILVANSADAKIFRADSVKKLTEIHDFKHIESQMPAHDLVSDRPGTATNKSSYGTHMFQERTPQKVKEKNNFAHEIADYLREELNKGSFERLYFIAPPNFLGALRGAVEPSVAKLVFAEIEKDVPYLKPEEILKYLPPTL